MADPLELALTVAAPGRPPARVLVRAGGETTVAELAAALAGFVDLPPGPAPVLHLGERPLAPAAPLRSAGLVQGAVVGLGAPVRVDTASPVGPWELAVAGGLGAGGLAATGPGDVVTVGRSSGCGLVVDDPQASRHHATVTVDADGPLLDDAGSTNGVDWAGHRLVGRQRLADGDVFRIGDTVVAARHPAPPAAVLDPPAPDGTRRFNRPPRISPARAATELVAPEVPVEPTGRRFPLISLVAPVLVGVVLALVLRQVVYLAFVALSPVMLLANHVGDRRQGRREYREQRAAYDRDVAALDAALAAAVAADERDRRHQLPDPAAVRRIALGPTGRLWERRRGDDDFLRLRVGLASAPAGVVVRGDRDVPDARLVPVPVDLAAAGVVGLAGPRPAVLAWSRALLTQLAALHGPRDVRLVVLTGGDRPDEWAWTAWLPHLVPPDPAWGAPRSVGAGRLQAQDRLGAILRLVDERDAASNELLRAGPPPGFRVLVVVDGARALRSLDGLADVLARGPGAGVYVLCLDDDEHSLPEECRATVTAADPAGARVVVRGAGAAPLGDVIADGVSAETAEDVARALAPVRDAGGGLAGEVAELPRTVRLLDLLGLVDPAPAGIAAAWRASPGGRSTTAVLGMAAGGAFAVDLRRDGPHGLVAGTTGAGKSELLQTLVASLAVANRPDAMTFVLVDYKGGSAFKECRDLPHCVGLITDLDGHLAARALASLTAELKRRETLLAEAGARDLEDYWALSADRAAAAPAPALGRLAIVVDEFATLVEEVPDFVRGVVGIGMRGRSLGVHVILATQRPAGVVSAELRANVNLRLCLRVANPQESADVIEVPDAARIARDRPGRAYALTGYRELTAFQTARVQAPRTEGTAPLRRGGPVPARDPAITVEALTLPALGARPPEQPGVDPDAAGPTDLTALVAAVRAAAETEGVQRPPSPWCPPLDELVLAGDLPPAGGSGPRATLGMVDRPEQQRQEPFVVDLDACGSLLVAGAVRSGRTTTLRTLAAGLCAGTPPDGLHLYAVDCGNGGLGPLAALPHVGAVVAGDDADRLTRLVELLSSLVAARARGTVAGGANAARVVVLLDRFEAFVARYAERDGGRLVEAVDQLLREGPAVGVTFVVTGDRTAFSARLASAVASRLVLRQADRGDYALLGVDGRQRPTRMPAGRAVWAPTGREVQVAVVGDGAADEAQVAALGALAASLRERWPAPARRPRRVDPLPVTVTVSEALALGAGVGAAGGSGAGRSAGAGDAVALVGVGGDELAPVTVDLSDAGPGFVIAGPPRSGRSTALETVVRSLSGRATKRRNVLVVTPRPSPLAHLGGLPGVAAVVAGADLGGDFEAALAAIEGPAAIAVDDAELIGDGPVARLLESLVRTARDQDLVVVAAATTDDLLLTRFRGWLADARRSRSGLLLTPGSAGDGELFDLRLPRSTAGGWPVGRGILVHRGAPSVVQVAQPG